MKQKNHKTTMRLIINFQKILVMAVCALNKQILYHMSKIHKPIDVMFDEDNINLLIDGAYRLIKSLKTKNQKSYKYRIK